MMFEVLAGDAVVARLERDGSQDRNCGKNSGDTLRPNTTSAPWTSRACMFLLRMRQSIVEAFVPRGYPNSVQPGYARFQLFDSLQALCSYLRGVLSTRAVLSGLGVGSEAATLASATTQWVYRDGAGMLGGIIFTWYGGERFGANTKGWRLLADLAVDVSLTLELLSPLLCGRRTQCFTGVMCSASVLRAVCGVAAGATRVAITAFFAGDGGNVADVQAKEGSQETAVSLVGMAMGLWLTKVVDAREQWVLLSWFVFVALTVFHLVLNYLAVAGLCIPRLNEARFSLLLSEYEMKSDEECDLSIEGINKRENFLLAWRSRYRFAIGVMPKDIEEISGLEESGRRCIVVTSSKRNRVEVVMRSDCELEDVIKAIADAVLGGKNEFLSRIKARGWKLDHLLLRDMGFRIQLRLKSE